MRYSKGVTLGVVASVLVVAAPGLAAGPVKGTTVDRAASAKLTDPHPCWPGWGYGDENHDHCGPPGLVDNPSGQPVGAAASGAVQGKANAKAPLRSQARRRSGI